MNESWIVIILSVAVLILTVANVLLSASIPFLWMRAFKLEQKIEQMDEALTTFLEAAGLKEENKR